MYDIKSKVRKKRNILDFIKIKFLYKPKDSISKEKDNPQNVRMYLQIIYLIRTLTTLKYVDKYPIKNRERICNKFLHKICEYLIASNNWCWQGCGEFVTFLTWLGEL